MTTTTSDLVNSLTRFEDAARRAGLDVENLHLQTGSKTYGRAYRLHLRNPVHGGLSNFYGTSDFLGMTKAEAVRTLDAMTAGLHLALLVRK